MKLKRLSRCIPLVALMAFTPRLALAADAAAEKSDDTAKSDTEGESGREDRLQDRSRALGDRIKSVQRKAFLKRNRHELGVNLGATLNDSFFYNFSVGASYTYHVRESFALEANARYYYASVRSDAVRVVRAVERSTPFTIFAPLATFTGEAQFSPIYGKMSLMAEKIVHYDVYAAAGFGAMLTDGIYQSGAPSPWHPLGVVAIGARVVAMDWLTVRLEVRDQIYSDKRSPSLNESAVQNMLMFNIGVSFFLPPTFDYRYE